MSEVLTQTPQQTNPYEHLPPPPDQATQEAWAENQHAVIAKEQARIDRAAETMERMDHKEALYMHLGKVAMGEESEVYHRDLDAGGRPIHPRPQTFVERFMDTRLQKKAHKKNIARTRQAIAAAIVKQPPTATRHMTKGEQRQELRQLKKTARREGMYAHERKLAEARIKGAPPKHGEKHLKKTTRVYRGDLRGVQRGVKQPVLSRWRRGRQQRAIGKIQEAHARAEEARHALRATGQLEE